MLPKTTKQIFCQKGYIHLPNVLSFNEHQQYLDFDSFRATWNDLPLDNYLSDKGKYRYRRYSVFLIKDNKLHQLPNEPHYQSREYNNVNGGYFRHYQALTSKASQSPVLKTIIDRVVSLITTESKRNWRVQCHQFRICATDREVGKPTPEGIHQDGADYVFIMLVDRKNIIGAINTIHNLSGDLLYEALLDKMGEAILLDDKRLLHGVSDLYQDKKNQASYRDVLVLTFHQSNE